MKNGLFSPMWWYALVLGFAYGTSFAAWLYEKRIKRLKDSIARANENTYKIDTVARGCVVVKIRDKIVAMEEDSLRAIAKALEHGAKNQKDRAQ